MLEKYEKLKKENLANQTDEGNDVEQIVINFLRESLPNKYAINSGYILNTKGEKSVQQDIIIYDKTNSFLLKRTDGYIVVPIEFVMATIEVKSSLSKAKIIESGENIESVKKLQYVKIIIDKNDPEKIKEMIPPKRNIFCSIFSFSSPASLESVANNIKKEKYRIDSVTVLDKGNIFYFGKDEVTGENGERCRYVTTQPDYEKKQICFLEEKSKDSTIKSGLSLFSFLECLLEHLDDEYSKEIKVKASEYFEMPNLHKYTMNTVT